MTKIPMQNPIVEMDGDEMTRILWQMIKDELILPFVELNTEYYDLGLPKRDETDDQITVDAANAAKKYHVAVKCATITPNAQRVEEYHLKKMYKSPNGTIRAILDGTVFRTPIVTENIKPLVPGWKRPITIARHAYGDLYRGTEYRVEEGGQAKLTFTDQAGNEKFSGTIFDFEGPGILQGIYNKDDSMESFARSCFSYALSRKEDLWFSVKDTISKVYDGAFRDTFQRIYDAEYKEAFEQAGITYFYTLIDDAVARVMRSSGGMVWALRNYDGDVMSDMVSAAFGALAMMTSVLVSPDGNYEFEAAHGTVTRHYYRYLKGEIPSTNPVATIFAWSGALKKRGELDGNAALTAFGEKMERATVDTIEEGYMTKDLVGIAAHVEAELDSLAFLKKIREKLEA